MLIHKLIKAPEMSARDFVANDNRPATRQIVDHKRGAQLVAEMRAKLAKKAR